MSQVQTPPFASPVATGGGGVFFEQHAGAAFLSFLLVRGIQLPLLFPFWPAQTVLLPISNLQEKGEFWR